MLAGARLGFLREGASKQDVVAALRHAAAAGQFRVKAFGAARL